MPGRVGALPGAEKGIAEVDLSSLKSPSKLDLARNPEDIELADDLTIENEMQKSPPESIL